MSENFTLQILHHADFEGNTNAIDDAPRLAALFDFFDDTYTDSTLKLSGGDNWIPSPWYNSQAPNQTALITALQEAYETLFGLTSGMLSGLTMSPGVLDQAILNILGIQASALGNHDFDQGDSGVERIIEMSLDSEASTVTAGAITNIGTLFPYITANLDFSLSEALSGSVSNQAQAIEEISVMIRGDSSIDTAEKIEALVNQDRIAPATTVEVNGELIGIVGATTQRLDAISSPGDVSVIGATDDDMALLAQQIQAQVDALLAGNPGLNKVVLLTHLQDYQNESELAGLLTGVDIILSAGSDAIFADETDVLREGQTASETYPLVLTAADGKPVLQINTDGQYQYLGRLVVEFDADGVVLPDSIDASESGAYVATDSMVTSLYGDADPYAAGSISALVKLLADGVSGIIGEKIANVAGYTDVYLNGARGSIRNEETNLGNLTADANLEAVRGYINENMLEQADVALVSLKNGGGIRSDIGLSFGVSGPEAPAGGGVTQLDIETALAFNNGLALVQTTVAGLVTLLEHGIVNAGTTSGRFPQVGGMSFSFDNSVDGGNRLVSVQLDGIDGTPGTAVMVDGELVVDADMPVNIATLDFLALNDGDGYLFSEVASNILALVTDEDTTFDTALSEQNALFEYLQANFGTPALAFDETDVASSLDTRIQNLSARADTVFDEVLTGSLSDALVSAGFGFDTVSFNGRQDNYVVEIVGGLVTVSSAANAQDANTYVNVESLQFGDEFLVVNYDTTDTQVATLYDVLLDRQADLDGFQFWNANIDNGAGIGDVVLAILGSQEYQSAQPQIAFTQLSASEQIGTLYTELLGRQSDAEGQAYWEGLLNSGATLAVVAQGIVDSVEMVDVRLVAPTEWNFFL